MEFELTKELIDSIEFGMENQDTSYYVDTETGFIVDAYDSPDIDFDDDRYLAIPDWTSTDGFNLMEQFVAQLKNPPVRERLREVLSAGRGVFRGFKMTLREYPAVRNFWHRFKEQRMQRVIVEWYNDWREEQGLEAIAFEEDESESLLDFDFTFEDGIGDFRDDLVAMDQAAFADWFGEGRRSITEAVRRRLRIDTPTIDDPKSIVIRAHAADGPPIAFIWAIVGETTDAAGDTREPPDVEVLQVYVVPEYRGLGMAHSLVNRLIETTSLRGLGSMYVPLFGDAQALSGAIEREGGETIGLIYSIDLADWRASFQD